MENKPETKAAPTDTEFDRKLALLHEHLDKIERAVDHATLDQEARQKLRGQIAALRGKLKPVPRAD